MASRFDKIVEEFKNKTGADPKDIFVPDYIEFVKESGNPAIEDEFERVLAIFVGNVQKTKELKGMTIPEAIRYMSMNEPPNVAGIENMLKSAIMEAIEEIEQDRTEERLAKQFARRMGESEKVYSAKQTIYMVAKRINIAGAYRTFEQTYKFKENAEAVRDILIAGSEEDSGFNIPEYVVFEVVR